MLDAVALGELLIDFSTVTTDGDGYPTLKANPGGAPCNFLAALTRYGGRTAFIGKVGADCFGKLLTDTLKTAGIGVQGIISDPDVFTTLAFVSISDGGERSFSFARKPGADTCLSFDEIDLSIIDDAKIFHFGSLSLSDEPARTATIKAVNYAKNSGKLISFDPNLRLPLWENGECAKDAMMWGIRAADFVKISDEEINFLWKTSPKETVNMLLTDFGVKLVLVTMGAGGALIANAKGTAYARCPYVTPVDTTGAGDICGGSAISRFLKMGTEPELLNLDQLKDIVRFSVTAASLSTQQFGGIPSIPSEIDVLLICRDQDGV